VCRADVRVLDRRDWTGARPNVGVADVNVVKQVLSDRTGLYPKILLNPHISRLLGNGLVFTDGDDWKRHRKVVHPAFSMDKLKMMTVTMSNCTQSMMSEWEAQLAKGGDVEVELSSRFEELTADVISHTAFGSSYVQGKKVFLAQRELQFLAFSTIFDVQIPGFRYLPTEKNLKTWRLDKQVRGVLMDIIKTRLAAKDTAGCGNDLLGLMLEACAPEHGETPLLSMDEIIDECKTFFAGHDTTSHLLTWAAFLLSTHPEWQDRLREEVRRECGDEVSVGEFRKTRHPRNVELNKVLKACFSVAGNSRFSEAWNLRSLEFANVKSSGILIRRGGGVTNMRKPGIPTVDGPNFGERPIWESVEDPLRESSAWACVNQLRSKGLFGNLLKTLFGSLVRRHLLT
jgi:cytochrome P450